MGSPQPQSVLTTRTTVVMLLASVLPLIDSSLVNVLLPAVSRDLGVAEGSVQPAYARRI